MKFASPDSKQILTLTAATGKRGVVNVKATVKNAKDEEGKAERAITGMRGSYLTEDEAQEKIDLITKEVQAKGWQAMDVRVKNAFTEIPLASGAKVEEVKAPKGARK